MFQFQFQIAMILRWVVVVGTVAAAAAQSPVIKTTGQNNIAIQIPVGSSATVSDEKSLVVTSYSR